MPASNERLDSLFTAATILAVVYGDSNTEFRSYSSTRQPYEGVMFSAFIDSVDDLRTVGDANRQAATARAIDYFGAAGHLMIGTMGNVEQTYDGLTYAPRSSGLNVGKSREDILPYLDVRLHTLATVRIMGQVSLIDTPYVSRETAEQWYERRRRAGRADYIGRTDIGPLNALLRAACAYLEPRRPSPQPGRFLSLSMPNGEVVEIDPRP
jgi:hypothetical protein